MEKPSILISLCTLTFPKGLLPSMSPNTGAAELSASFCPLQRVGQLEALKSLAASGSSFSLAYLSS